MEALATRSMTKPSTSPETMTSQWTVNSWRNFPISQQPLYENSEALGATEARLRSAPPLTIPEEARKLKRELGKVAQGKAFLLQGGDCAESFAEFSQENLKHYFKVLLQMTVALMYGAGSPVVKVGRIAGQFAKPRSADMESFNGCELPSYRGDMVNGSEFSEDARRADPERMIHAYHQATATLNYLRSLAKGGFSSLNQIMRWNMDFIGNSPQGKRFRDMVTEIGNSIRFMEACGLETEKLEQLRQAEFYTSHEALLMPYEEALTRQDVRDGKWYNCSAHMLWIGDRTRNPEEAHVEYMRGIANPIGMKVGPSMKTDDLKRLLDTLNPENEAGRLTLITRMGAAKIGDILPPLVRTVKEHGITVVWSCDPMHGNTIKSPNGYKTRKFTDILSEVRQFFAIHKAEGTQAGGVHFEMTGQDVTECLGGAQAISEIDLSNRYHTHCDPRLNGSQSLELAFLISEELRKHL